MKEFSLISYRWKNFEEKERLNLVQSAELEVEKNKIVNSLIEFISLIQNEKMNSMSDNG